VTEPTCPLCAHLLCDATVVGTRARHGFASRRVVCAGCGLVQVSPQPPVAELDAYYASGQYRRDFANTPIHRGPRQLLPGCAEYEEALDAQAEYRAESLIAAFELETLIAPATLEIGCGEGRTTAALLKRGIAACAVETDATMRVKAAARGVQALADWPAEMPETVALWHVLEHLPAPVEALREIRTRGAKRVFVEVPDVDAYLADREGHHFQHVHLFDFSVSTLASMRRRSCSRTPPLASARCWPSRWRTRPRGSRIRRCLIAGWLAKRWPISAPTSKRCASSWRRCVATSVRWSRRSMTPSGSLRGCARHS